MSRGGRRKGAGAPAGNLNAVKSGIRSKRVMKAVYSGTVQEFREVLARVKAVKEARQARQAQTE